MDHVRFLYRKEREFPVHVSEDAYRDYLRWYLTSESRTGKPPYLGPQELSYLNAASDIAPLPGLRLSNATKLFLADYKTAFPDEEDPVRQAENLLYWWCVLKLQELNVCGLIPESYMTFLNEKPLSARPETRFRDAFARHNFRDFPLDTAHPDERRLMIDRLSQVAGAVPQLRPLLPDDIRDPGSDKALQPLAKESADTAIKNPTGDSSRVPSVRLFGPLKKLSGLGQASRLSHALLSRNGFLCETQDVSDAFPSSDLDISLPAGAAAIANINLFHLNAEMIPDAARRFPRHVGSAYNIAYCFWELDKPATAHLLGYDLLDEVWVSSDFGKDALAGYIPARVTKVGLPCREVFPSQDAGRSILAALGVSDKTFKFICSFDALSYLQRKNPIGTIRAFQDAFTSGEDVALIIKTHSRQRAHDAFQDRLWEGIVEACETDKRIYLVDKDLEQDALDSLTASCDCLVSLHRAEAWGFGMIDAMSLGVPVIATAYSGNLEFCNPETTMLVDYELIPVMDNDYAFAIPSARWAEPEHESAVRALRSMFTDEAARRQLQSQAKGFVETHFSFEAIGKKYSRRLREIHEAHGFG
jgi:glycosyltransferase involved in cell wall biosynthesis